jgi:hypothetical protein
MDSESLALLVIFLPHAIGGIFLGWRLLPAEARGELRGWWRDDDDGPPPSRPPVPQSGSGGNEPPMPDAVPSPVRLREPGRLADRVPAPARRPEHPPVVPERKPEPQRR